MSYGKPKVRIANFDIFDNCTPWPWKGYLHCVSVWDCEIKQSLAVVRIFSVFSSFPLWKYDLCGFSRGYCKKATSVHFLSRKKVKENRMAIIILYSSNSAYYKLLCIKLRRTSTAAQTVLIKLQIVKPLLFHFHTSVDIVGPTAGTACCRTAWRSGPAVALHQSPAIVFYRGDRLYLAVLRDVQVKAVGAVWKQQHIVDRVPARSTMRFRYDLQTCAMTVDGEAGQWWTAWLVTRPLPGWRPLVRGQQVVSIAMFTAPLTFCKHLQTADLTAAAHLFWQINQ